MKKTNYHSEAIYKNIVIVIANLDFIWPNLNGTYVAIKSLLHRRIFLNVEVNAFRIYMVAKSSVSDPDPFGSVIF